MKCSMEETKERSQPCYSGTSKILVERHLTHDVPFPHAGNRLVIRQKICYHTRVKSKGASGVSRRSPDPHNPRGPAWSASNSYKYTGKTRGSQPPSDVMSLPIHRLAPVGHVERSARMKRSSYGERDYAFGQAMLTLRTTMGLTQAELAEFLGVSRKAVGGWESGGSYPKTDHLKEFLTLCVRQHAFPAGREAEEIRALWHAAHQKLLRDEAWLAALLGRPRPALTLLPPVPLAAPRPGKLPAAQPPPRPQLEA